jgi:asparagine synthase (glutamine-hydrolysing)
MCGFAGFLLANRGRVDGLEAVATQMANAITHRGPDDFGAWADAEAGIALGFRRLSIVDLSAAGHQPMISSSGRFVIAFNGEIYNHWEIRAELDKATGNPEPSSYQSGAGGTRGPTWRGHSDTETLLSAFDHWGIEATLGKCVGMFAIALWDVTSHTLHLARDRFGEKPLYY